jgi:hypothetical protein
MAVQLTGLPNAAITEEYNKNFLRFGPVSKLLCETYLCSPMFTLIMDTNTHAARAVPSQSHAEFEKAYHNPPTATM